MKFEYKGIEIRMTPNGNFVCNVNGVDVTRSSRKGCETAIDKAGASGIKQAKIIEMKNVGGFNTDRYQISEDTVVNIKAHTRGYKQGRKFFVTEDRREPIRVILDTPVNRKALQAVIDHKNETEKISLARSSELAALNDKLVFMSPEEYIAGGKE